MSFPKIKIKFSNIPVQLAWLCLLIFYLCSFNVEAQSKKPEKVIYDTCETSIAKLGSVINDFLKDAKSESYLVIIGGAMKGEKASYNSRRIQQSIGYFDFAGSIKSNRIVFGTGIPETGAGYLRFYVNGILITEISTRKNAKLCWGEGQELDFKTKG